MQNSEDKPKRIFFNRQPVESSYKSFRKSRDTELSWIRDGFARRKAVKDYHNSFEGRKMHRQLTRFNQFHPNEGSSRIFY